MFCFLPFFFYNIEFDFNILSCIICVLLEEVMKKVSVKYLIILIVPIFIELVLQLLAGNVDKIMVQSDNLATAINQANSVLDLLIVAISVLASSSLILINQYKGAKLKNDEEEVYRLSFYFYLFVGVILSVLLLLTSKPILLLMQVDNEILDKAYYI